jgi:hypothetical protein
LYLTFLNLLSPLTEPLSRMVVDMVVNADPSVFEASKKKGEI